MSTQLHVRRSTRERAPPRSIVDEMQYRRLQDQNRLEITRAVRAIESTAEPSDSNEEDLPIEAGSESEGDDNKENVPPWSAQLSDIHPPQCSAEETVLLPRNRPATELGYLQQFIDSELVDTFVTQTNAYATARAVSGWVDVTTEEMWRYLAIRIRQGIVQLPDMHMYWSHEYRDHCIGALMTRDRFVQLHRNFHIVPPVPPGVRQTVVEKTAPFYHKCQQSFQAFYQPGRNLAVDETMIRFQGRSKWITVIKNKPTPEGYKLYTVASNGYLLGFRIFRGRGGYDQPVSVLHHTIIDLVNPWSGAHRWLFFDNLYTSPALCDHLLSIRIHSCGTCRLNRAGLPANIRRYTKRLQKGERNCWQRGQLGCIMWNDSKPVVFLSNQMRVDHLTTIDYTDGRPSIERPTVAVEYNNNKGHVDQVDQLRSYYIVQRRGQRTWPSLAWWLLDTCISNAYKLWCVDKNEKPGLLHFREQLVKQIAAPYPSAHTPVQPTVPPAAQRGFVGHWPKQLDKDGECAHCSGGRKKRRRTVFECKACHVHLHVKDCFGDWHDRLAIDNRTV